MARKSRRELLKAGAAGTLAAGLVTTTPRVAEAQRVGGSRRIHIHGRVTNPAGGFVDINATVFGPEDDLSGSGWDTGPDTNLVAGACYWTVTGTANLGRVILVGTALLANNPANLAARITLEADGATGDIAWSLTRAPYTTPGAVAIGKGVVVHD